MKPDIPLESHLGYVLYLGKELAEVELIFDGVVRDFTIPRKHLDEHDIQAGHDFFFDVYANGRGVVSPAVFYGPLERDMAEFLSKPPLTLEELDALDDAW